MRRIIRIYFLEHTYESAGCVNTNTLGLFLDEASAKEAADSIANKPGFRDYPMGFHLRAAELYALKGETISCVQEIFCAYCNSYRVDDDGVEHETIMEGALYTARAEAETELNEWQLGGLLDDAGEDDAGVGSWVIGRIASGWKDGFDIYHW